MTDAFMERLLANKEAEKDKDKVGLPSWEVDPHQSSAVIEPWPGASYTIPEDLVELVKRGIRPPLVWLTVEALVGAEDGETRKAVTFPLNNKQQERINEAYRKDAFLPRGSTHQALQILATICRAVGPAQGDNDKNHAVLLEELHLELLTRVTDAHWPEWRRYIRQALEAMWAKRDAGVGLAFDVSKINETLVRKAERQCGKPPGHVEDFTGLQKTWVAELLRAEGSEVDRVGATMEALREQALFNHAGIGALKNAGAGLSALPSGPVASISQNNFKRKERDADDTPFRRAPPSSFPRDGGASIPTGPRVDYSIRPTFCTVCLKTGDHDWRTCRQPHSSDIEYLGRIGWRWRGKPVCFCSRFNSGRDCLPSNDKCSFGHYCSSCGADGHAAVYCPVRK